MTEWKFYGRETELSKLTEILDRSRWFFVKISGRRRIGKTTLIQQALKARSSQVAQRVFYVQIPDSGDAGVLSAVIDALETFNVPVAEFPQPKTLQNLAKLLETLARAGYIVVLDEFQYFNRKPFTEFCSFLQAAVDRLSANPSSVPGGLIVLGSIQTEMAALLEDRSAPLYNRITDELDLGHLDISSVLSIISDHAEPTPERLLFLWTLFEGVPKFYRDCWEQSVLDSDRATLLRKMFFDSSSPLRSEAENWFLRELRGKYDTVLKFVASNPGSRHGELVEAITQVSGGTKQQLGGYLKTLCERFRLVEAKSPIFSAKTERKRRYYITDNFLHSWLGALSKSVAARDFQPLDALLSSANTRLETLEGIMLERLVGELYEERSRKGIGEFPITQRIEGYWDRNDTEIDLVALNEPEGRIRFGSCKRSPQKLVADINNFKGHVERFLEAFPKYRKWNIELCGISPRLDAATRTTLAQYSVKAQDLIDLTAEL
jgi:uncharacterized protein